MILNRNNIDLECRPVCGKETHIPVQTGISIPLRHTRTGFPPEGGWGISPPQMTPLNLRFFENLINLSVILKHLEAELSIL
jgi:hypothetical protein